MGWTAVTPQTVCVECRHLHAVAKSDPWYRWLCAAAPLPQVFNHVTGLTVADPPYMFCRHRNHGDCPDYLEGFNVLRPKERDDA